MGLPIFAPFSSEFQQDVVQSATEEVPMNSLFRNNHQYQTFPQENEENMGMYSGLLIALLILCVFFIRRLQGS